MKRLHKLFSFMVIFGLIASSLNASGLKHRFIAVDNGANKLIHVDQLKPERNWSVKIPGGSRDLQMISADSILLSHGNGAGEYSLKDGRLLKTVTNKYRGIQSARRMLDGTTLLAKINGEVYLLDKKGKEIRRFKIDKKRLDIRLVRVKSNGNLLIGTKVPFAVLEVDMNGKIVKEMALPHKGYKAHLMDNGHVLASTGDAVKVVELDTTGKIVRFVGGKKEHPQLGLDFFSGFDTLPNGNVVATNWLGHGKHGTAAHLIEFSPDNKVVWKWEDHKTARQVTNFLILDNWDEVAPYVFLYDGGKKGTPLTKAAPSMIVERAYEIQDSFAEQQRKRLGKVTGYKVAYASKASQQKWGIPEPAAGPLFAGQFIADKGVVNKDDFFFFHIETEVGFLIAKDIDQPIKSVEEVAQYVKSVHSAFDIPDNRFNAKPKVADIVGTGAGAHRYAFGKGLPLKGLDFTKISPKVFRNGEKVYEGKATNVMGDPCLAVMWLANNLLKRGKKLYAGQMVVSGAVGVAYCGEGEKAKGKYVGTAEPLPPVEVIVK